MLGYYEWLGASVKISLEEREYIEYIGLVNLNLNIVIK